MDSMFKDVVQQITTRDLADDIDRLIILRVRQSVTCDYKSHKEIEEDCELLVRRIADGFKQHSGARGITAFGDNE